jgi:hypothetical protein
MTSKTTVSPVVQPGDRIVIESERVGQHPREGTILGVTESALGPTYEPSYEVRWDDGHESSIRPAAGSARVFRPGSGAKH